MKRWQLVPIEKLRRVRMICILRTGAPPTVPNLITSSLENLFVCGILPLHEVFDDMKETLAFLLLGFFGREKVRV